MPRLTEKAKELIKDNIDVSSRKLVVLIVTELNETYSNVAINDYKRKIKQQRASAILNKAVQRGEIIRPAICEKCGNEHKNIVGHHENYDKPLEVDWLCMKCHQKIGSKKISEGVRESWRKRKEEQILDTFSGEPISSFQPKVVPKDRSRIPDKVKKLSSDEIRTAYQLIVGKSARGKGIHTIKDTTLALNEYLTELNKQKDSN